MVSAIPCLQLGFFFGILFSLLASRYTYTHAQNVSIDDTSPRWTYTPPVCPDMCDGINSSTPRSWWQTANQETIAEIEGFYNLTNTATNLVGATASLDFFGTAIYYYALLSPWGGNMTITIDGVSHNVITQQPKTTDSDVRQHLVYHRTGLNGTVEHKLTVKMSGGYSIDVDRVDITLSPNASDSMWPQATSTTTTSTLVHQSGPTAIPTNKGPMPPVVTASPRTQNTGAIIGGTVGGAVLLVSVIALIFWRMWRPRRSRGREIIEARRDMIRRVPLVLGDLDLSSMASSFWYPSQPQIDGRDSPLEARSPPKRALSSRDSSTGFRANMTSQKHLGTLIVQNGDPDESRRPSQIMAEVDQDGRKNNEHAGLTNPSRF